MQGEGKGGSTRSDAALSRSSYRLVIAVIVKGSENPKNSGPEMRALGLLARQTSVQGAVGDSP